MLEQRLQATFPGRHVEVINVAFTAVNSYTLLDQAEAADRDVGRERDDERLDLQIVDHRTHREAEDRPAHQHQQHHEHR